MKIDPHDISIRLQQARKFLMDGHKVQIVQNFRGREMLHRERGHERMANVISTLEDIAKVEMEPRMAGRRMSIIMSPDKNKINQILREEAAKATAKSTPAEVEAPAVEPEAQPDTAAETSED